MSGREFFIPENTVDVFQISLEYFNYTNSYMQVAQQRPLTINDICIYTGYKILTCFRLSSVIIPKLDIQTRLAYSIEIVTNQPVFPFQFAMQYPVAQENQQEQPYPDSLNDLPALMISIPRQESSDTRNDPVVDRMVEEAEEGTELEYDGLLSPVVGEIYPIPE